MFAERDQNVDGLANPIEESARGERHGAGKIVLRADPVQNPVQKRLRNLPKLDVGHLLVAYLEGEPRGSKGDIPNALALKKVRPVRRQTPIDFFSRVPFSRAKAF